MDLNDWILSKCGGTWDMPHVVDVLQDFPEAKSAITAQLRRALRSPMARHYLGTTYWARHSTQAWLPFEWGWKDPRNTFTLPLWMELFPAAKIVNVERHGIDVALSLKRRLDNSLEVTLNREGRALSDLRLTSVRKLRCANGGFRCGDLRQGMRLWATYSQRARSHCMQLGDQALTVRFETLLDNPDPVVRELLDFAGLEGSQTARTAIARSLDPSKALAWKAIGDPQLKDLEEEFRHSLNELYY